MVRLETGVPFILLIRRFEAAPCGGLAKLPALVGDAEFDQMADVLNVVEEGLGRAALLEFAVVETGHDNMVDCVFGVGDGDSACLKGYLEITVCCDSSDSGSKGFRRLLRELLGLVEMNPVDCCMKDRHCQGLDSGHHQCLSD